MTDNQTAKNIILENQRFKIWVGDDGIIRMRTGKTLSEEDVWGLFEGVKEVMTRTPGKGKILVDISNTGIISSSRFRKEMSKRYREMARDPGWKKIAVFCGNIMLRTIASFVLIASGVKNVKTFKSEKEALKWLKQP